MSELIGERKEALRGMIARLHAGESPANLKQEFEQLLGTVTPLEISQLETQLIKEGVPREQMEKLCDVHMELFRATTHADHPTPTWHPIHILMEEHAKMLKIARRLEEISRHPERTSEDKQEMDLLVQQLIESESHYLREENVLFPYLEKHGITEPPAIMWMEHDRIRAARKEVVDLVNDDPEERLTASANDLAELFAGHFEKENSILYPSALEVIAESEWHSIRSQFDEIGYTSFTPDAPPPPAGEEETEQRDEQGKLMFSAGALSINEIEAIFDNLPVDITFIDNEDTVRYFNQAPGRIFVRSEAIIGRKVQNCHPQKSVHVVNRILDDFKSGKRDEASFWIDLPGKTAYIRYFPVKDKDGSYLGTIEVSQDIKPIRELNGEKRLLDGNPKKD